jgi:hypothetical protein
MTLRVAIVSSSFLLLSACCCRHVPGPDMGATCWSSGGEFGLSESSEAWQKLVDQDSYRRANPPSTTGNLLSACQSDFELLVQGVHCRPLVETFCEDKCQTPCDWGECRKGKGRSVVAERCWRDAFPGFQKAAPTCAGFTQGPNGLPK